MAETIELELQADENGEVHISKRLLGNAAPYARFRIRAEPVEESVRQGSAAWATLTPEERAKDLRELARSFGDGPGLSDWAVSRDAIYDE